MMIHVDIEIAKIEIESSKVQFMNQEIERKKNVGPCIHELVWL